MELQYAHLVSYALQYWALVLPKVCQGEGREWDRVHDGMSKGDENSDGKEGCGAASLEA